MDLVVRELHYFLVVCFRVVVMDFLDLCMYRACKRVLHEAHAHTVMHSHVRTLAATHGSPLLQYHTSSPFSYLKGVVCDDSTVSFVSVVAVAGSTLTVVSVPDGVSLSDGFSTLPSSATTC